MIRLCVFLRSCFQADPQNRQGFTRRFAPVCLDRVGVLFLCNLLGFVSSPAASIDPFEREIGQGYLHQSKFSGYVSEQMVSIQHHDFVNENLHRLL